MKILIITIIVLGIVGLFFINTYTSSPGFTTPEMTEEFYGNSPKCYGLNFLLNEEEIAADAPGKSLCIGLLR